MKELKNEMICKFDEKYRQNKNNKIIENAIKNVGIKKFCLNNDVIKGTGDFFNIELPKSKIYNQENSGRCWLFAGINLIKNDVAKNLNVNESDFALSANYISFLDKLEKSNTVYNRIIENPNFDFAEEMKHEYLQFGVFEGGYFEYFREIVNKFGLVPENVMPEVMCSRNSQGLMDLLDDKINKDMFKIINAKTRNKNELHIMKEQMLQENYNLLSKCLGELPLTFDFEYKNKEGKIVKLKNISPIEFARKYLTINLNDFVALANVPMYNKEYNKLYRKKYFENVFESGYVEFINSPIEVLKEAALKQLKAGVPVYLGCNVTRMQDKELGIMDANLFNYADTFEIDLPTKREALNIRNLGFQHVMLITGAHVEDDKIIRWKIEDSHGDKTHKNGYYIMNDNFFDSFVLEVVVDKKYLGEEQLKVLGEEPILFECTEPF